MSVGVVIVAAGSGSRLAASVPKAFVLVGGRPLLEYAVRAALSARPAAVVVAAPASHVDEALDLVEGALLFRVVEPLADAHGGLPFVPCLLEHGEAVEADVRVGGRDEAPADPAVEALGRRGVDVVRQEGGARILVLGQALHVDAVENNRGP
ncbi:MAG TPA: 2-C-methyl-D-erythritol 4-phosphate cytidylyltransferase, partial [Dermatophilaceae bacterium]|nr:2-C-methyl-D-erythritol 4-phosphate cytidylyltransferase [Dermatophilaceae bacterium]